MLAGSTSVRTGILGIGFKLASMLNASGLIDWGIAGKIFLIGRERWSTLTCFFRKLSLVNDFWHNVHENLGFSWMRWIWSSRCPIVVKMLLQKLHGNGRAVSFSLGTICTISGSGMAFCNPRFTRESILKVEIKSFFRFINLVLQY